MGLFRFLRRLLGIEPWTSGAGQRTFTPSSSASRAAPGAAAQPRQVKKLNLDPGAFAPMSHSEVKDQARKLGAAWRSAFFGRTDLIPPPNDPRTALLDRAMVGQGLLTPEQLKEIHEVGLEMDQVRPDLAQAGAIAAAAVATDLEERRKRKERLRAESAERKRLRAEAVAQRKIGDIIFLGRGVSRGLADRTANVDKLQSAGLPVLATPADVAGALGMTIPRLRWLAFHSDAATRTHYVRFTAPKKSGGVRELAGPHRDLARAQRWVLDQILQKLTAHPSAHGFVAGKSTVSNATPHVARTVVVNADLKDFFPSITFGRVRGFLQQAGYSPAAATVLALLCTESPRRTVKYGAETYHVATGPRALPQGACTSPALSNLICRRFDARLAGLARKLGWTYTRYADDLSFSAEAQATAKTAYLLARVRHIALDEGFVVNEKKTRVLRQNAAQSVTGILVNQRPGVSRRRLRRLRAILHHAKTEGLAAQNRRNHPRFDAWLRGMIAYVAMVNPRQAGPLRTALAELDQ